MTLRSKQSCLVIEFWFYLMSDNHQKILMAGKPKRMSIVKQLLRMHHQGKGHKTIARSLEISKNTVKNYLSKVKASGIAIPMFRSTKKRSKNYRIKEIVENVIKYFDSLLLRKGITLQVEQIGSPIIVKCNEGVLMQTFINILDNSVYWLDTVDIKNKEVKIILNGNTYEVVVADNGPGIFKP